jgi:phosphopantetheinyl transferase (holo-ACP synthase)
MSTGNDIVFLPATRPERTGHPRFYRRIITPAEQKLFPSHYLPFDHYVWLCWSIKESAYKFHRRLQPGLRFAPLKIAVSGLSRQNDCFFSTVTATPGPSPFPTAEPEPLYARSTIRDGVIVTVVSGDQGFTYTRSGFHPISSSTYQAQSLAVRTFALRELRAAADREDLRIEKDADGCPHALAQDLSIPISLAHHDRYVAWSFTYSPSSR